MTKIQGLLIIALIIFVAIVAISVMFRHVESGTANFTYREMDCLKIAYDDGYYDNDKGQWIYPENYTSGISTFCAKFLGGENK